MEVTYICPGKPCLLSRPDQVAMSVYSRELRPYLQLKLSYLCASLDPKGHRNLYLSIPLLVTIYIPGCGAGTCHPSYLLILRQWGQR